MIKKILHVPYKLLCMLFYFSIYGIFNVFNAFFKWAISSSELVGEREYRLKFILRILCLFFVFVANFMRQCEIPRQILTNPTSGVRIFFSSGLRDLATSIRMMN